MAARFVMGTNESKNFAVLCVSTMHLTYDRGSPSPPSPKTNIYYMSKPTITPTISMLMHKNFANLLQELIFLLKNELVKEQ